MPTLHQLCQKQKTRKNRKHKGSRSKGLEQCPQRKGFCMRVTTMKPKKPNSAIRKIVKVKLSTAKRILCYIPGRGHNLREYSVVLVRGGHVPDLPGIQYHLIKGKFDFSWREAAKRTKSKSKYGIKRGDFSDDPELNN